MTVRAAAVWSLAVPAAVLLLAYAWLAHDHGTLRLWHVIVHESGRYTLQGTVLYFNHTVRELPILLAMAGFAGASYACATAPRTLPPRARQRAQRLAALTLGAAVVGTGLVVAGAVQRGGLGTALRDLLQFHTRDDISAYGSHWRYHGLSTVWFGVAASLAAPLVAYLAGRSRRQAPCRLLWLPWLYVAFLTLIFGLSSDILLDVRYAGHQAREIQTHGLVTLPLVLGALLLTDSLLATKARHSRSTTGPPPQGSVPFQGSVPWFRMLLFLVIPAHLAAVSLTGALREAGQFERGWAAVVAGHTFEHALDYGLVTLLAVGGYSLWQAKSH